MPKTANTLLNMLYAEWLKTHDPFTEDFDDFISEQLPNTRITKLSELEYTILSEE